MNRSEDSTSSCFANIVQRFVCTGNLPTHPYPPPPPPPYGNEPKTHKIIKTVGNNGAPATTSNPHQKSHVRNNNKRSPQCNNPSVKDLNNHEPSQHQVPVDHAEGEANGTVPGIVARLMGLEWLPQHWAHSQQHNAMASTTALRSKSLNALYLWPDFDQTAHELQQQRPRFQHRRVKSSYVSSDEGGILAPASTLQTMKQSDSMDDDPYAAAAESKGSGNSSIHFPLKSYTEVLKAGKIDQTDQGNSVLLPNSITEKKKKKKVEKNTSTSIHTGARKDRIKNSSNSGKDERKTAFGDYCPKINSNRKSDGGIQLHVSPRKESGEHGNGRINGASDAAAAASKKKSQAQKTSKRSDTDDNVLYNKDLPPDDFGSNHGTSSRMKKIQLKGCYKDGGNQHSSSNHIMHEHTHVSLLDHLQCSSKFDSPSKGKKEPTAQITTNSRRRSGRRRRRIPQQGIKLSYEEKTQEITLQQRPDNYQHLVGSGEEEKGGDSSSETKRERWKECRHVEVNMEQVSMLADEYIRDVIWVEKNVVKIDRLVQELSLRFSEDALDVLLCQLVDELRLV